MTSKNASLEKFLDTCRTEFEFLVTEFGFQEISEKVQHNPYKLSFFRDDLLISIEGIHYGSAALILIRDRNDRVLSPANLDPKFVPLDKQSAKSIQKTSGQSDDIQLAARLLREHGTELLEGNFTVFEEAYARKEKAVQQYEERRMFGIAIQQAVAAYEQGEWHTVVTLLEPHESSLSKKMVKKLSHARGQL
jgi:hypothetical protein